MDVVRPAVLPGSGVPVARTGPATGTAGTAGAGVTAGAAGEAVVVVVAAVAAAETEGAHSW